MHNPLEIKPFIPDLMPGINKVIQSASQPEVRELAGKALHVLQEAENDDSHDKVRITEEEALDSIPQSVAPAIREYVSKLIKADVNYREFSRLSEVIKSYLPEDVATDEFTEKIVDHYKSMFRDSKDDDNEQEGIRIVNANFSLAYGGRMLLNKTF